MQLNDSKKKLCSLIVNVGTSGKFTKDCEFGMSDYLIRYVLMNFISFSGSIILIGFITVRLTEGKYGTVAACTAMLLAALSTMVLGRVKKVPQIVPSLVLTLIYGLLCIAVTWLGEANGSNFLFIYMYPLITIMLLGMRYGIIFSVALLILVSLEMFIPELSRFDYHIATPIHMLVTYFLVFSVMVVVENTRKTKDRLIKNQNEKLQELKEAAETANSIKSAFLASMSHEIRTPMNAITGMAELLLRGNLSDESRGYAHDIKHAGANLIAIINDILDFSKIEAGKLEIVPVKYLFASLINDVVSIIRMRLAEKPVRFFTNIDSNIPNGLEGDEVRLRQILLNLLSNAAKYTTKGQISVSITQVKRENKKVWLDITISDTGQGIRPEDQKKLFGEFVQFDTKKNRNIEGTGLGLAITKRLCTAMDGSISVESEYGKGSSFTVIIPQEVHSETPFAAVEDVEKKKVLVFERRAVYAQSVCWSLDNMNVSHALVTNQAAFVDALGKDEWFYVFSGYGLYNSIKPVMDNLASGRGEKPPLALMVEWGYETYIPNVRFVSLPIQSLSIANVLNGKADSKSYFESVEDYNLIRFTIPQTRLLVVDDITTNLKVAEGLLAPYYATVDTCLSGMAAIELVKHQNYDLIFMDHMMPEMDGIEAAAQIRALKGEQIPIVALTANAVSGVREMFMEKGFSDFLAKPIDISKLDEILARWIPKEKREKKAETKNGRIKAAKLALPIIPGVDVKQGIAMTGGTIEGYLKVLSLFCKDAEERLVLLKRIPDERELSIFTTQIHALKGASAALGATGVSTEAARLEAAGKNGDIAFIQEYLPKFTGALIGLVKNIKMIMQTPLCDDTENVSAEKEVNSTVAPLRPLFIQLVHALKSNNPFEIDRLLDEINDKPLDLKTKKILENIADQALMTEYGKAVTIIEELLAINS